MPVIFLLGIGIQGIHVFDVHCLSPRFFPQVLIKVKMDGLKKPSMRDDLQKCSGIG